MMKTSNTLNGTLFDTTNIHIYPTFKLISNEPRGYISKGMHTQISCRIFLKFRQFMKSIDLIKYVTILSQMMTERL